MVNIDLPHLLSGVGGAMRRLFEMIAEDPERFLGVSLPCVLEETVEAFTASAPTPLVRPSGDTSVGEMPSLLHKQIRA